LVGDGDNAGWHGPTVKRVGREVQPKLFG
jgi:hypothetical protein